jgi:type IV pilus assembly protein PilO
MIEPANQSLKETQKRIEDKKEKLTEIERVKSTAENLSKRLDSLEKTIKVLESRLPPESEIHKVLRQVSTIAGTQGLETTTVRTLKTTENKGYIEQPLKLELKGKYSGFYSFLIELEKLPRVMQVRQLKVMKQKDMEGLVQVNLVVSVFFEKETA